MYCVQISQILGVGMSEKMWDVTLKHARDCVLGSKLYIYGGSSYTILLNPICEIVKVVVNGQTYSKQHLSSLNSVRILYTIIYIYLHSSNVLGIFFSNKF